MPKHQLCNVNVTTLKEFMTIHRRLRAVQKCFDIFAESNIAEKEGNVCAQFALNIHFVNSVNNVIVMHCNYLLLRTFYVPLLYFYSLFRVCANIWVPGNF